MHTLVLVVVPPGVADVEGYVADEMKLHHRHAERPETGHWDYYVVGGLFDGRVVPDGGARGAPCTVGNNRCQIADLTTVGAAIVTPDHEWHDARAVGHRITDDRERQREAWERWERRAWSLLRGFPDACVVAIDAHS